ncbi:MAG: hypothetical protein AAGC64_04805 [Bacteroidota bacterium]
MKVARYIIKFLLAFIFIYAGIEKLFISYNPSVFRRAYLLGSVMMVPLMLCLLMTHVFLSKNIGFMILDSSMSAVLVPSHYKGLRDTFFKPQMKII